MLTKEYVLGFVFNEEGDRVLLIHKQRPDYQQGKWNGLGGKIEDGEIPKMAMMREFFEECGIFLSKWEDRGRFGNDEWCVHVLTGIADIEQAQQTTDEPVQSFPITDLPFMTTMPHTSWLINLCRDKTIQDFHVEFK
jgi:8-oxo-dGTP diphosphatase